ncbi:MAG TPA: EamA family transporter [Thermomicrobiales bacterium]|nr:EamA family transporter [Thermomicrobiales bacterium]
MNRTAGLALLGATLIWGFVPVSTRHVVGTLEPGHILLARFVVGAAVGAVALGLLGAPAPPRRVVLRAIGLGLLGQLGFNVPLAYGIQYVASGTAALVSSMSPVFMALLAVPLLNERLRPRVVLGLLLALIGSAIVVAVGGGEIALSGDQVFGSLLMLLSAILWAIYSVIVKPWLGPIPPTSIPMVGSIAGLPLMLLLGTGGFAGALGDLDPPGWLAVVLFTVGASVVAPILWAVGLQGGAAARAGMFLYLVPLVGVVSGAILLGEPVGVGTIVGGALVLFGVAVATLSFTASWRRLAPSFRGRPAR